MMNPNKFNIGDKVWFKLDSYGKKAERYGTICCSILCDPISGWQYDIETGDNKHWNIPEKDINYSAPHTRESITKVSNELEERVKRCRTCKYWYLTGSSEPCKSCANSSKRNLNWEPKEKDEKYYAIGMPVRYSWGGPDPDNIRTGFIVENSDYKRGFYVIKDDRDGYKYNISANRILGYNTTDILTECGKAYIKHDEESIKEFLNRVYGNPDFKPEVHSDAADSLSYSIKRKLDWIRSNAVYGLNTDTTFYDEFVNKEDNKMKNQKKRNRNLIRNEKYSRIIKDITFNGPAVIIKFEPTVEDIACGRTKGDKVVVVCKDGDKYDMKTGFLLAILKEFLNNQSYGNILEKLDSFDAFDIPQVGKDDIFKFKVGDIVRLKHGVARFKVDKCTTFTASSGKLVPRYRIVRLLGSKCSYSAYANENELVLAEDY